jgi:hypothetical protein
MIVVLKYDHLIQKNLIQKNNLFVHVLSIVQPISLTFSEMVVSAKHFAANDCCFSQRLVSSE